MNDLAATQGSLARRLAWIMAALLIVGGLIVVLAALGYGRKAADQAFDRLLQGAATQIAESVTLVEGKIDVDLPRSAFELLALAPDDRVFYALFAPDGQLLTGDILPLPDRIETGFYEARHSGETVRFVLQTRQVAERGLRGAIMVVVGQTKTARRALASEIARNALVLMGLAGVLMVLLAVVAVRSALGPLRAIEQALVQRAPQDTTPMRLPVPREIGRLVRSLNDFMGRIDRILRTNRRMLADASHQLRTPIASLRAQAELAADEPDPDRLREIVARIHARSIDLSRLTDQLLSRALIIHRADAVPLVPLDLREVALAAAEDIRRDLPGPGSALDLDLAENRVMVTGDALSLREACKNLLVNAVTYGQPPVTIRAAAESGQAVLAVRDAGAGPPDDPKQPPRGAGLGLAIAEAVAQAHGGRLRRQRGRAGFEVAVTLPLNEEPEA